MEESQNNRDNMEITTVDENTVIDISNIKTSSELADYLSKGNVIDKPIPMVESTQSDVKAYLSIYARSTLTRIEKLTRYLDKMEDKMMEDIDSYDPSTFLRAMQNLQNSLSSAIDLVKLIGTDEKYLSVIYNENNTLINNLQMGNRIDIGLSRESRDKLRDLISKMKSFENLSGGSN